MARRDSIRERANVVISRFTPMARYWAAVIAGLAITFTQNHSNVTGLLWFTVATGASLILRDGPATVLNRIAQLISTVIFAMTVIGLLLGKMSESTTLSLTIALAAFETARAFARNDRLWIWSCGVLTVTLSIVYFIVVPDSTMASGLTGAWGIVAGIFGLISGFDARIKAGRSKAAGSGRRSTSTPARKPKSRTKSTTAKKTT